MRIVDCFKYKHFGIHQQFELLLSQNVIEKSSHSIWKSYNAQKINSFRSNALLFDCYFRVISFSNRYMMLVICIFQWTLLYTHTENQTTVNINIHAYVHKKKKKKKQKKIILKYSTFVLYNSHSCGVCMNWWLNQNTHTWFIIVFRFICSIFLFMFCFSSSYLWEFDRKRKRINIIKHRLKVEFQMYEFLQEVFFSTDWHHYHLKHFDFI